MATNAELTAKFNRLQTGMTMIRILGEGASAIVYEMKLQDGSRAFLKYYFKLDADSQLYLHNESTLLPIFYEDTMLSSHVPRVLAFNDEMILMNPVVNELEINRFEKRQFRQLIQVLRRIHQDFRYVHRDLQPNNILQNPTTDGIFLIDWACSAKVGEPIIYDGTIFYAAEELIPLVFTQTQYRPKPAHDLESLVKILYHCFNQNQVDQCDIDICQLTEVQKWWTGALKQSPWPSYLKAAREENYEALLRIVDECFDLK